MELGEVVLDGFVVNAAGPRWELARGLPAGGQVFFSGARSTGAGRPPTGAWASPASVAKKGPEPH